MGPHVDHKQRIDLILQNAQELFSELGYQQVTLKLLAKRCHLSRTVLYRYYKSKRNVFEAVLFHIADFIGKEFMQYVHEHPHLLASEKLRAILFHLTQYMEENTAFLDAVVEYLIDQQRLGESVTQRVMRHTVLLRLALVRLIREGVLQGEFQAVHCTQIAGVFYDMLLGAAMQMAVTETHYPDEFRERLDMAIYALKKCPTLP